MSEANEAGHDLWRQLFERAIAEPDATVDRSTPEDEKASINKLRAALKNAGWSDEHIEARLVADSLRNRVPNRASPGVAPGLEEHLGTSTRIATAMADLGLTSHERVVLGIDPKAGPSASLTNVMMTDEGILSVSSYLFRWCGLISRAYVRTLQTNVLQWSESPPNTKKDRDLLLSRPELIIYWFRIFTSFALTGTHILVPFLPSTPSEAVNFEQLAWSMEFFVVAHEYAHHALDHRGIDADSHTQELEADALATKNARVWNLIQSPAFRIPIIVPGREQRSCSDLSIYLT